MGDGVRWMKWFSAGMEAKGGFRVYGGLWRSGLVGQERVFVGRGDVGIQVMELARRAMTVKGVWMGKRV